MSELTKSPMFQPLPRNHWLYEKDIHGGCGNPPLSLRVGRDHPMAMLLEKPLREAARFALKATSNCGTNEDLDPDALVRNVNLGLFGYNSATGFSMESWANPENPGDGHLLLLEIIRTCLLSGDLKPQQLQDIIDTHRMVHGDKS